MRPLLISLPVPPEIFVPVGVFDDATAGATGVGDAIGVDGKDGKGGCRVRRLR